MTDYTALIERLRGAQEHHDGYGTGYSDVWALAADAIEALSERPESASITVEVDQVELPSPDRWRRYEAADRHVTVEVVHAGAKWTIRAVNPEIIREPASGVSTEEHP